MSAETVSDALRAEVLHYLVHERLSCHPLPWTIENDWTTEVVAVAPPRLIVAKFPNELIARAFMKLAEEMDREAKAFDVEFEEMCK